MIRATSTVPVFAALVVACGGSDAPHVLVDHAGQPVALQQGAERIVSLSPSVTELLFTIGAGERVVGRTRWCSDPVAALAVPSVGDGLDPNIELIVAQRPDLVVFYHSAANASAIDQLRALGIATASVRLDRLEDLEPAAMLLASLVGDSSLAGPHLEGLATELAELPTTDTRPRPRVLILAWDAPPIVIGGGSFLSELVALAGGENVFADLAQPSAAVSIEAIVARRPDLVLLVDDAEPLFAARSEWRVVAAVRDRRFVVVSGTQFSWPSFRSAAAVRQLRTALQGTR
ncbi:MAG: helical backbone metal receptor [Gemmatimonadota bacterium]|nr:helical backbone metal receptor [Gemmatimonadota bacterium]